MKRLVQQLGNVKDEKADTVVDNTLLQSREGSLKGSEGRLQQTNKACMAAALDTPVDDAALLFGKMACFVEDSTKDNRGRILLARPGIDGFLKPYGLLDAFELIAEGSEVGGSIAILASKGTVSLCTLSCRLI